MSSPYCMSVINCLVYTGYCSKTVKRLCFNVSLFSSDTAIYILKQQQTVVQNYAQAHWNILNTQHSIWENIEHLCDAEIHKEKYPMYNVCVCVCVCNSVLAPIYFLKKGKCLFYTDLLCRCCTRLRQQVKVRIASARILDHLSRTNKI